MLETGGHWGVGDVLQSSRKLAQNPYNECGYWVRSQPYHYGSSQTQTAYRLVILSSQVTSLRLMR